MFASCPWKILNMQRQSIINKLQELREAAWNLTIRDSRSHRFAKKYAEKTSQLIREGVKAVGQEADETERMARSFFKMLEAKLDLTGRTESPTEAEVKAAIEQLKDVGKFSVFATLVILPGGIVSLVGLELLARKFGIRGFNLVPSSFRKKKASQKDEPSSLD
jgi:Mg2+ and Co2+ transporter CorA